jgi:23S rRNA pseudouridine2605 synthase
MNDGLTLIQYIAAYSGHSRRKAGDLIKQGLVKVNGHFEKKPWILIEEGSFVSIANKRIVPHTKNKQYFILNKPAQIITTMADDEGRYDVGHLIKGATKERLFPVGRLDKDSTGILLFTNDGVLAQQLSHPRFKVSKRYEVILHKPILPEHLEQLKRGLYLSDGKAWVDQAFYASKRKNHVVIELHSGKNRILRRLFARLGYQVKALDRVMYAGLRKKLLKPGAWRPLSSAEITHLSALTNPSKKENKDS